jgi:Fe-S cluster assembly iron-binding protein IscA
LDGEGVTAEEIECGWFEDGPERVEHRLCVRSLGGKVMLQLTPAAAAEVAEARRAQGLPEEVGVRVFGEAEPDGELRVGLAFAELPAEDDQVTERDGTRLFVAPEVAATLASSAIDVVETANGTELVLTQVSPGEEI